MKHKNQNNNGHSTCQVRLEFTDPNASEVCVAGTFNDWKPQVTPMLPMGNGQWLKVLVFRMEPSRSEVGATTGVAVLSGYRRRFSIEEKRLIWHPLPMSKNAIPGADYATEFQAKLLDRFLRYVRLDTQSSNESQTTPTTETQWVLLRLLENELREMGAKDISLSPAAHLIATIPSPVSGTAVPTVAFLAHVDTATDFCASGVKPLVHRRWKGKPIRLPDDPAQVLDPRKDPELKSSVGKDIITASGTTLLGADDKAGVAIIMTTADYLLRHPELPRGPIRVCFLPDEEVGLRGATSLDLEKLGANLAYTLDGKGIGEVEWESFSGDAALITIEGIATHPGEAKKNRMINAVHLAAKLIAALPREFTSPETTDHYEGYIHPMGIEGNAARTTIEFILRDFDDPGLADKRRRLAGLCRGIQATEPRAKIRCDFSVSYRNMAMALRHDRRPVDLANEATRAVGLEPKSPPIRGGTDGSKLSERGLPTPNLSCGGHNAHGPLEWVALQDMEITVKLCVELARLWAEKGHGYKGYQPRMQKRK